MKKFTVASAAGLVATGFAAVVLGLAAPASASGLDHNQWIQDIQQQATVGSAQSTVGNGR